MEEVHRIGAGRELVNRHFQTVPAPFAQIVLLALRRSHWTVKDVAQPDIERLWLRLLRRWLALPLDDKLFTAKSYLDALGLAPNAATERLILCSLSRLVPESASAAERNSFLEHSKIVFQMLLDENREQERVTPK